MTTTLQALDWPVLLATPMTRWYLDRMGWDISGQCEWQTGCPDPVVAFACYDVCELPGDASPTDDPSREQLVCSHHLPDLIAHALEEPLVSGTVVEVGVDPALLRLTGVDPAVVDRFNDHALGVAA